MTAINLRDRAMIARATMIALVLGVGLNVANQFEAIFGAASYLATGRLGMPPVPLMAQAFTLPVLFSFLAQTLTYRRAILRAGANEFMRPGAFQVQASSGRRFDPR